MARSLKKIVHLTSVHRPLDVRIFQKQCRSLAAKGFDVVLVAVHDQDEWREGVRIQAVPRPSSQLQRMTVTAWHVFREALRQRADLYQIHDPELLPWALILRLLGQRVVYDMHENVPQDIIAKTWLPAWIKGPVKAGVRLAERLLLWRLPVVFAETSYAADYPWVKRSAIVLNLPQLDLLPPPTTDKKQPFCVGYIGGVGTDRGSQVTVEALGLLKARGHDVGWECVGPIWPPSHEAELRRSAAAFGLNSVNFYGYRPAQEGWRIVRHCQVGLAVLLPKPNIVESYPTKLFEYMALEMPVIASDFPLYREVLEPHACGLCVDPESPAALADAIERLASDHELCQAMGKRGRLAVEEHYNWTHEFEKLCHFYEQLP